MSDWDQRAILGETPANLLKLTESGFASRDHGRGYIDLGPVETIATPEAAPTAVTPLVKEVS